VGLRNTSRYHRASLAIVCLATAGTSGVRWWLTRTMSGHLSCRCAVTPSSLGRARTVVLSRTQITPELSLGVAHRPFPSPSPRSSLPHFLHNAPSMPPSLELHHVGISSNRDANSILGHQFDICIRVVEHVYLGFFNERSASHSFGSFPPSLLSFLLLLILIIIYRTKIEEV
jgi:hypothetical protein